MSGNIKSELMLYLQGVLSAAAPNSIATNKANRYCL